ncbi:hypothetical protein KIF59_06045 [Enterobacter cloacae subsp. cloacae]|nr:hypothetical protein [Enterobacter cloacae subsp. cloacae]
MRPSHQKQVAAILNEPEASQNDKYVALQFCVTLKSPLKACCLTCGIPARRSSWGKKGQRVWTGGGDEAR